MKLNRGLIFLVAALWFMMLPSLADTFHVATDGDDVTGDGTVGNPFLTINKAFLAAKLNDPSSGPPVKDTILVQPGTYNECVVAGYPVVLDSPVEILSSDWIISQDNSTTIIDGSGECDWAQGTNWRKATVAIGSSDSKLEGFTIRGGGSSGVTTIGSVVISNNVITENYATRGAGIYIYSATRLFDGDTSISITDNLITANHAVRAVPPLGSGESGGNGGGIYVWSLGITPYPGLVGYTGNVLVTIDGNTITNNTIEETNLDPSVNTNGGGLGIFTDSWPGSTSEILITNNTISGNASTTGTSAYGGGAWLYTYGWGTENIAMTDNTIAANIVSLDGAGVSAWSNSYGTRTEINPATLTNVNHSITLTDNTVTANEAGGGGGGFDLYQKAQSLAGIESDVILATDNTISGNTANSGLNGGGGGILITALSWRTNLPDVGIRVHNNRVLSNVSASYGGGISTISQADGDPPDGRALTPAHAVAEVSITNNLVSDNTADDEGGSLFNVMQAFADAEANIVIDRTTLAENTSQAETGGIYLEAWTGFNLIGFDTTATLSLNNSIINADTDDPTGVGIGGPVPGMEPILWFSDPGNTGNLTVDVGYSDVYGFASGNYDTWITDPTGTDGCVSEDPLLSDIFFKPAICSVAVDGGDPAVDASLEPSPNGDRINMGAYGGTASASTSMADIDGDRLVDGIDVLRIATSFLSLSTSPHYLASADLDGDGDVDGDDLSLLAADYGKTCVP